MHGKYMHGSFSSLSAHSLAPFLKDEKEKGEIIRTIAFENALLNVSEHEMISNTILIKRAGVINNFFIFFLFHFRLSLHSLHFTETSVIANRTQHT